MNAEAGAPSGHEPRGPSWSARHPTRAALTYGVGYLLVGAGGALLAGAVKPQLAAGACVTLVASVTLALSLLMVLSVCRIRLRPAAELAWMLAALAIFPFTRPHLFAIIGRRLGSPATGERLAEQFAIVPGQELLGNIALVLAAVFLGRLVSRVIREGKLILPVAVVASAVDIFTVFWGVVAEVGRRAPDVVNAFSASAPVTPPEGVPAPILAAVGVGDFLFLALFLSVALRSSMDAAKTTWVVFAVMLVAPFAFFIWPQAPGLPGIPFIAAAVLAVNRRHLSFSREEKRALAFASVLVVAVGLTIWAILRQ